MQTLTLKAPAKLNLTLDIAGKRADGYHLMQMVMQTITLYDTVSLERRAAPGIAITGTNPAVPCDERNLCHKAALRFFEATNLSAQGGVAIYLKKVIPMEAGLAGGSTDAAAVLVGLNELFSTGLTTAQLCALGVTIGADVPFCIQGGTMLSEGIGELFTPLPPLAACWFLVAKPEESMKTPVCFARYDALTTPPPSPDLEGMTLALAAQELREIADKLCNVLEPAVPFASIAKLKSTMLEYGALGSAMTGSGTAVFGLFETKRAAKRCANKLLGACKAVFLAQPLSHGVEITEAEPKME